MKKPNLIGLTKEQRDYVEESWKIINAASKLQLSLALISDTIANDVDILSAGETEGLIILSSNKDDKSFERLVQVIKLKTELFSLSLQPKEEPKAARTGKKTLSGVANPFEAAIKELKNAVSAG